MDLQKVTDLEKKTEALLKLNKVSRDDLNGLTKEELSHFTRTTTERINNTEGEELDLLLEKVDPILSQHTKNELWEHNHRKIIQAISTFIDDYGRMPLKMELVQQVGLSRQTIHRHLKEYKENLLHSEYLDQFEFMTPKLVAKMFQFAIRGDVKAGRLYFDMVGALGAGKVKNQTNYIQINNIQISEEKLKALTEDQLKKVEDVLAEVLEVKLPR
jgi:hypothetical protein